MICRLGALLALCLGILPQAAAAAPVDLYRDACVTMLPTDSSNEAVQHATYHCGGKVPSRSPGWLWLKLDAARLGDLAPGWSLLVDQARFREIAVIIDDRGRLHRWTVGAYNLQDNWAPGGLLRFPVASSGKDIHALYVGFRQIDDLSLMRKVAAVNASEQERADARWLLLMGIFAGTLGSALLYNLVIHTGRRTPFQRWYLAWVSLALAYGLVWTNTAAYFLPDLVGPLAVRLDFILVGLMVGAGNMFFLAVIEDGILPRPLLRCGRVLAGLGAVLGIAAAADTIFPPVLTDRLLNYVIAATAVSVGIACWIAVLRRSRVVWFYLIGWSPVIAVFLARLARNLGFMPQIDMVDMATFTALAFEALVLSLAIADRFRFVRRDLDAARERQKIAFAEAEALRSAARTDFLTGVGNRSAFQENAQRMIAQGEPFSLFLIDVDYLKDTNDRLGHIGGDALLQRIAASLEEIAATLPGTVIARIGGDEFALLCPGDRAEESRVVEQVAALQGLSWRFLEHDRTISLSAGSSRFPGDAEELDLLYQNADIALYKAKRHGRSRHFRYDARQRLLSDVQAELSRDAEAAISLGEFVLHYQPFVAMQSGEIIAYEALVRWDHPVHGLMRPDRFAEVLVAERHGLIVQEHVLDLALTALREHGDAIPVLSVNFTAAQLSGPRSARRVLNCLAYHRVKPSRLCVEVTESVLLDRAGETIRAALKTLQEAGVQIALDDFGTGCTSLSHLRDMPIDSIKIDRSFVASMDEEDGGADDIVRAIIGLGHALSKEVIAEGVETRKQSLRLLELGCRAGQGYLYAKPSAQPLQIGTTAAAVTSGKVIPIAVGSRRR